eukprot:544818_1
MIFMQTKNNNYSKMVVFGVGWFILHQSCNMYVTNVRKQSRKYSRKNQPYSSFMFSNIPSSALLREIYFHRIKSTLTRIGYICLNFVITSIYYDLHKPSKQQKKYFHFIQLISTAFYYLTSFSNPGYIKQTESKNNNTIEIAEWNKKITIDADNAPSSFCWRCKFLRPLRSKHCYDCDKCIAIFDSHIPFVGNCIGARNNRYFLLYLYSHSIIASYCLIIGAKSFLIQMKNKNNGLNVMGLIYRGLFSICMLYSSCVSIGLCTFRTYMALTNQTTYEMIKPQVNEKWIRDEMERKKEWYENNNEGIDNDIGFGNDEYNYDQYVTFGKSYIENIWVFICGYNNQKLSKYFVGFKCVIDELESDSYE